MAKKKTKKSTKPNTKSKDKSAKKGSKKIGRKSPKNKEGSKAKISKRKKIKQKKQSAKSKFKLSLPTISKPKLNWEKSKSKGKKTKKRSRLGFLRTKKFIAFSVIFASFAALTVWLFWGVPFPTKIAETAYPVSTKLYDRNGEIIYEIYADRRNTPLDLEQIPDHVVQATISIEDKDFYNHFGFSVTGMARAVYKTLFKQRLEGGSTLTQQLVKNTLLTPERTIPRKIREFALTLMVEAIYSKDQILEIYLNQIPYGSTAYGIGAASELYFDKPASELTLAEATLLAGLPAAPTRFSPFGAHPELAKGRQEAVLRRMVEEGYIDQETMDETLEAELKYAEADVPDAPHFALWIKDQLAEEYGDVVVETGGLRVTTTLDMDLQLFAQEAVAEEVAELKSYNVGNGATIVTQPTTGQILAMVGSKDFFAEDEDGKVNVVFANRQPGSSIKPLNYALGIEDEKVTAGTPLADVPTCFTVTGQAAYCPRNYDGTFHGIPHVRYSLANSYNVPAVRVLAVNGLERFIEYATSLGITTFTDPDRYGLSLTLGGGEVRPYDMAQAFGVLANRGIKQPLYAIQKVEDYKGNIIFEAEPNKYEGDLVMNPGVAFIISKILSDNGARTAAFGPSSFLNVSGHPEVAAKTGTTNDRKDNWTIGYTDKAVVVVWVGNNDNTPMSGAVSGVSGASPIFNTVMQEVLDKADEGAYGEDLKNTAWPIQPDNVVGATICSDTGNIAGDPPNCPTRFEYFLDGAVGARLQSGMKDMVINKLTGQQADPDIPEEFKEIQNHGFVLDPLGTEYCLDCPIASHSATIRYPLAIFTGDEN